MPINNGGNISVTGSLNVGATTSTTQLNVFTSSVSTQNVMSEFYNSDYTSGTRNFVRVRNNITSGSTMSSYFGQGQDGKTYIVANDFTKNHIVIDGSSTYVGIAKSAPNSQLDVNGNTTITGSLNVVSGSVLSTMTGVALTVGRASGNPNVKGDGYLILDSNTSQAAINYYSSQDIWLGYGGGSIAFGHNSPSFRYHFKNGATGVWSTVTESPKTNTYLSHGDGYGIAVDSAATAGGSIYLLKLASGDGTNKGTTVQFQVWSNGNTTVGGTLTENSSIRYKENVEDIKYGLDKVLQMRGVTYNKKSTGERELGLIAEEVNEVLPEVVLKNEEGEVDSVSYGRVVAVLIEAVKDLQSQINELKNK